MCHLPRTAWQNVCNRPSGSTSGVSLWTNMTPDVPSDAFNMPALDDAVANRPRRAVACTADDHAIGRQPQRFGRVRGQLAGHVFRFVDRSPSRSASSSNFESSGFRPLALHHVEQQHAAGVAHLGGELASESAANLVFRQQHLGEAVKVLRFMIAEPKNFRRGETGQGRIGDHADQLCAPAGPLFDFVALGGRPLIVPQKGTANDLGLSCRETPSRASGPTDRSPCTSAGLSLAFLTTCANGLDGRLPPIFGVLLAPQRLGVIDRIAGAGLRQDFARWIDRQRLGAGRADVDADVHVLLAPCVALGCLILQSVSHARSERNRLSNFEYGPTLIDGSGHPNRGLFNGMMTPPPAQARPPIGGSPTDPARFALPLVARKFRQGSNPMRNAPDERRIVITGLGLTAPNGNSIAEYRDALLNGRSGVAAVYDSLCRRARSLAFATLTNSGTRNARRSAAEPGPAASASTVRTRRSRTRVSIGRTSTKDRVGIYIGITEHGNVETENEIYEISKFDYDTSVWTHHHNPRTVANNPAGEISLNLGITGPAYTIGAACAAGNAGLIQGAQMLLLDECDVALAGGVSESIHTFGIFAGFASQGALATHDDPTKASRPFDKARNGIVVAEGGCVYVLERLSDAKRPRRGNLRRSLPVGRSIATRATSSFRTRNSRPQCMRLALERAGLKRGRHRHRQHARHGDRERRHPGMRGPA